LLAEMQAIKLLHKDYFTEKAISKKEMKNIQIQHHTFYLGETV